MFLDQRSKIKEETDHIKEEKRESDFSEEDDKYSPLNEDEVAFETKIKVEYHGVQDDEEMSGTEKLFKCNVCPKQYRTRNGLSFHEKKFHRKEKQERFECDHCDFFTVWKSSLKTHLKIHDKNNYLKCQFCNYTSPYVCNLYSHSLRKHKWENMGENKTKIEAEQVKIKFEVEDEPFLDQGSKIGVGDEESGHIKKEENYLKCHFCQHPTAKILGKSGLKNEGENIKIHKCTNCSYSYVLKSHFDRHLKQSLRLENHKKTQKKINKCLFCNYHSNTRVNLDHHILRIHPNFLNKNNRNCVTSKVYECQHCKYKTAFAYQLKAHLNNTH